MAERERHGQAWDHAVPSTECSTAHAIVSPAGSAISTDTLQQ